MRAKVMRMVGWTILVFCVSAFSFLSSGASAEELKPTTLTWVAGGVGGGWYTQAGGIAQLINEKEPRIVIKVVPGGGVVNPVRVAAGQDDLGWGITFVDKMAYDGLAPLYKESHPKLRAIGGYFGYFHIHFVAAKETGVKSVGDLAEMIKSGKAIKIAIPMMGTSDLPIIESILNYHGVSFSDIEKAGGKTFHAIYADMVSLYQDRHVDFVATHLSLPAAAITEMFFSRDSTLLSISEECIDAMHEKLGTVGRQTGLCSVPAGTYTGQDSDVPTVATAGELLISEGVPEVVAYTITKILCENVSELYAIHEANKTFDPQSGWENVAVPLHVGAERYYKEKGYLK